MAPLSPQQTLDLAMDHHRAGRLAEAETLYRQLLARFPESIDVVHLLGVVAHHTGRYPEALACIERSIRAQPHVARYYNNLGLLLVDLNRLEESATALETAQRLEPGSAEIHYNLGNTRSRQRQWEAATTAYRTALQIQPRHAKAWTNLCLALAALRRREEALASYQTALELCPTELPLYLNLGTFLGAIGRLDDGLAALRRALALAPGDPSTLNNLSVLHKDRGEVTEALAALRQSLAAQPNAEVQSNLIFTSLYDPAIPEETIREEQRRWDTLYAAPLRAERQPHENDRSPDRLLRIGYVSADLRHHAVGRTLLPIFEAHDRREVECVCYAGQPLDAVAQRFHDRAQHWRNTETWSDEQLAAQIHADRIDILVDLSLHTAYNRLRAFARKPAPIQVSWLGYPGSTGLETIDYWLTDRFLDPRGAESAGQPGRPFRMPDAWCCYPAPEDSPAVSALPVHEAGVVTFASFNNFAKINDRVLTLWARVLDAVPISRLQLLAKAGGHQQRAQAVLQKCGIDPERCQFSAYEPAAPQRGAGEYLRRYQQVDIALDPFPYNGMTTSGDALWMGVPVVALRGATSLGRASFSILSNLGMPELAATTEDEYVQIATRLAGDLPSLAEMRATLRARMQASPLLDQARFARHLETAYRTMWRAWCQEGPVR